MSIRLMSSFSVVALVFASLWAMSAGFAILLQFLVCTAAVLVVIQAVRRGSYRWAAPFGAIALLYNPVTPVVLGRSGLLWLNVLSMSAFAVALYLWQPAPRLAALSLRLPPRNSQAL